MKKLFRRVAKVLPDIMLPFTSGYHNSAAVVGFRSPSPTSSSGQYPLSFFHLARIVLLFAFADDFPNFVSKVSPFLGRPRMVSTLSFESQQTSRVCR